MEILKDAQIMGDKNVIWSSDKLQSSQYTL